MRKHGPRVEGGRTAGTVHTFTIVNRAPSPAFQRRAVCPALIDLPTIRMMMNVVDVTQPTLLSASRFGLSMSSGTAKAPQATLAR